MYRYSFAIITAGVVCLFAAANVATAEPKAQAGSSGAAVLSADQIADFAAEYCLACHNDALVTGGMSLQSFDLTHPENDPELAEKIIRKLKVGFMPPVGETRPDADTMQAFVRTMERQLDSIAGANPNPGSRPFQRLTRDEYANSIRDLFGIDVDVAQYLPADMLSEGMDNIADQQAFSASLMEGYMRAAGEITRAALGDPRADATSVLFKANRMAAQLDHVPGTPFGTRGGLAVTHNFPADGEYRIRVLTFATAVGNFFSNVEGEGIEVSIDGERVALLEMDPEMSETDETGLNLYTPPLFVKAGPHNVAVSFVRKFTRLVQDNIKEIRQTLIDTDAPNTFDLTIYAHLREFEITGPHTVSGVSDSAPRRAVFTCRPLTGDEEARCASEIVRNLARKAYRRPVTDEDMEGLMLFYDSGRRDDGDFESGVRAAIQAMLTSPYFVFKFEVPPEGAATGESYYIGDLPLASRISYFLWGTPPDERLVSLAAEGRLGDPSVVRDEVDRMLADRRSIWLSEKFASLWLHLPDLMNINPDPFYFPQYDHVLAKSMEREVELFFDSIVREDRNALELLDADYTFLDERLALHYEIPNVRGNRFRRVTLEDDYRRGLLGKGAILAMTSNADRTSPVLRGKWVMQVLLATDPPAPPPVVPAFDETEAVDAGKILTVRERMEMHRANPVCAACHKSIDPLGLALENFDVTGKWRVWDKTFAINDEGTRIHTGGIPIDAATELHDGTPLDGPASLRNAILTYGDAFVQGLTEKLMSFAIGRRIEHFDVPSIRAIARAAAENDNRFSWLVKGIVESPAFRMNAMEEPVTEAAERQQ